MRNRALQELINHCKVLSQSKLVCHAPMVLTIHWLDSQVAVLVLVAIIAQLDQLARNRVLQEPTNQFKVVSHSKLVYHAPMVPSPLAVDNQAATIVSPMLTTTIIIMLTIVSFVQLRETLQHSALQEPIKAPLSAPQLKLV